MRKFIIGFIIILCIGLSACVSHNNDPSQYFKDKNVQALIYAIEESDQNKIKQLLVNGVDINSIGKEGVTPLFWALVVVKEHNSKEKIFKLLLENEANPLVLYTPTGKSVLTYAAINLMSSNYLKSILETNPDIDVDQYLEASPNYPTALYHAIFNGNFENVKLLIENGSNVNYPNINGSIPLELATGLRWEIAYYLLLNNADYNHVGFTGKYNPESISEIVLSIERNSYLYDPKDGIDWREKVIEFLQNKNIKVYPWYPEDDPRYNPRPSKNTELKKETFEYTVKNNQSASDNAEKYTFSFTGDELNQVIVKSSTILFNTAFTSTLTYKKNKYNNFILINAEVAPIQKIFNLNTKLEVNKNNLPNLTADDIGIIVDEIGVPLSFVFKGSSLEDIIDQYGQFSNFE